jgi:hypothetical protein
MYRLISLACLSFLFAARVCAQDYGSYTYPGTDFYANNNSINVAVMNNVITKAARDTKSRGAQKTAPSAASSKFTPSAALRSTNLNNFVADVARTAPEEAPKLASALGNGLLFTRYGQQMKSIGLDANNVSDHMAVWSLIAWEAAAGKPIVVPPAVYGVVKKQVDQVLSNTQLAAKSNADKQKMADEFMIRSLIMANQIKQAKTNQEYAKQLAIGTRQSVKASGLDFDKMTLTEDGFVAVKAGKEK